MHFMVIQMIHISKNVHFPREGHDYGVHKRWTFYKFIANHFRIQEIPYRNNSSIQDHWPEDIQIEPQQNLVVFNSTYPRPPNSVNEEEMTF
jgi:hypothetical protein